MENYAPRLFKLSSVNSELLLSSPWFARGEGARTNLNSLPHWYLNRAFP